MPLRHQNFICGLDCHGIWNIKGAICRFLSYLIRILFFHGQCLQQWIRTTKLVPGKAIILRKTRNPLHKGFINSQFKSCECFFFISIIERDISTILRVNLAVLPSILWVPRGRFKNTYELLNQRALKFSYVNKIHIFRCVGKIFCVEFQRYPLKFHTKYLTHTLKDMIFMQFWNFKSS